MGVVGSSSVVSTRTCSSAPRHVTPRPPSDVGSGAGAAPDIGGGSGGYMPRSRRARPRAHDTGGADDAHGPLQYKRLVCNYGKASLLRVLAPTGTRSYGKTAVPVVYSTASILYVRSRSTLPVQCNLTIPGCKASDECGGCRKGEDVRLYVV